MGGVEGGGVMETVFGEWEEREREEGGGEETREEGVLHVEGEGDGRKFESRAKTFG